MARWGVEPVTSLRRGATLPLGRLGGFETVDSLRVNAAGDERGHAEHEEQSEPFHWGNPNKSV